MGAACQCEEGWTGTGCDQRVCNPLCIKHGTCKDGKCQCHQGWNGEHCTIGRWGGEVCLRACRIDGWKVGCLAILICPQCFETGSSISLSPFHPSSAFPQNTPVSETQWVGKQHFMRSSLCSPLETRAALFAASFTRQNSSLLLVGADLGYACACILNSFHSFFHNALSQPLHVFSQCRHVGLG